MAHMIMEHDNMFSVGTTPWHGLGVVLDNPPSVEEALAKANLDWTVIPLPLYAVKPGDIFEEVEPRAIMRVDTEEILGTIGANWTPLQNAEAFGIFAPLVEDKSLLLETAGSLKNGRRVWILARINSDSAEIGKGDEVRPYVLLSNAHDGTMAVRFGFTPIRVVCNNTLSAAEKDGSSRLIRIIHTPRLHENIGALRDMLNLSKASFEATIEQYRFLASRDVNETDLMRYIRIVFDQKLEGPESGPNGGKKEEEKPKPTENKIIELFESGIGSDLPKARTWWGAYNAFNEFLMYHRGQNADNRLNSAWFADGWKLNQVALNTALKMAA